MEQAAGTTGVYTDFKLEVDDGRVLYEGEMRSGWMEYEFEIDAVTGAVIDWKRIGTETQRESARGAAVWST